MNWSPSAPRDAQVLPYHLGRLGDQLHDLSDQVRASIAGLAGDAMGRAIRDAVLRFWRQDANAPVRNTQQRPRDYWNDDDWEHSEDEWEERMESSPPPEPAPSVPMPRLSLILQLAGWLLERGSLLGLFAVGLGVGGVALLGGRLTVAGFDVINGIADLASLLLFLSTGAKRLETV